MTIPRIPGVFDSLGQGLSAGLDAYNQQKQQQYAEAIRAANFINMMIQQGAVKPEQLSDPGTQQTFSQAKLPQIQSENVVPSLKAKRSEIVMDRAQTVEPGSIEEDQLFDIPGIGQVTSAKLKMGIEGLQAAALKDPALANMLTGLVPSDIAKGKENAARASIAPEPYKFGATNFVAQAANEYKKTGRPFNAQAVATRAKELATADQDYAGLVGSGQLSDEYFAKAANDYAMQDENSRQEWGKIAAMERSRQSQERIYYDQVLRAYDRDIGQLQAIIKASALTRADEVFVTQAQQKAAKGEPLNDLERSALEKYNTVTGTTSALQAKQAERDAIRDRFVTSRIPSQPTETGRPSSTTPYSVGGSSTAPQARTQTAPTTKAPATTGKLPAVPRIAGEADAVYWERLKKAGYSDQQATAKVRGTQR